MKDPRAKGGASAVCRDDWTAVIPAAGRGSRLGFDKPKILYPLLGRALLDWLLDALEPVCSRYVLVLSPAGRAAVEPVARARLGDALQIAIQETPSGMADAVETGVRCVSTRHTLVVWGDQVTLSRDTIGACADAHGKSPAAALTLASCERDQPYVDIVRDADGRITSVRQAREGEVTGARGENDCGLFLFSSAALREVLQAARLAGRGIGAKTGEFNLLPLLPDFERGPGTVRTVRVADLDETLGVNDPKDAALAEEVLRRRLPWAARHAAGPGSGQ
jgi:bifunctional UDP-N-acetylglucosamine pyrophosphorylase / glucosamine-1-phosphate N-acetyltransferase